ncbi:4'-phosphopantetheinyl transferase family protein [Hephaestia sp. GCM10023244]|uniref:4'-phosphopantetheinyl transferase family protein n=1 Tax=unclassified Hephaestia TaxID=2631281 RepID=UPI0020777706|nr:4'-phosphopantetheinyl transferase superfamily protein [Hephaestia sp. MAHUQ-44]MCM8731669.1 4'-phosphopantetheinyl transferase superfamily protein [Hephaestia sp. MAHUQ-44]
MASIAPDLLIARTMEAHRLELDVPFEIWRIDLSQAPGEIGTVTLSHAELARADRFRQPRDARRYLAAHTGLRHILEEYSGIPAAAQHFTRTIHGKPALTHGGGWQFNLSYAGDTALVALDIDRALGVDIERDRHIADAEELATLHFTAAEQAALARVLPADRCRAFLTGWTRKEACLKAWGTGLQRAPRTVDAGLDPATTTVRAADAPPLTVGSFGLEGGLIGAWACTDGGAGNGLGFNMRRARPRPPTTFAPEYRDRTPTTSARYSRDRN